MSKFDVGDVVVAVKDIYSFDKDKYASKGDTATVISSKRVSSEVRFDHNGRHLIVDNSSVCKVSKKALDRKVTVEVKSRSKR